MDGSIAGGIGAFFAALPDPRRDHTRRHRLVDIVVMAVCAVLCGAEDWEAVAEYAEARQAWFATFLELPSGIPAHDITSLPLPAADAITATRTHWQIENGLHWVLDMAFRKDESRLRKDNGAEDFAVLRRMALSVLKKDATVKLGVKNKRLRAGWDHAYLLHLLILLTS